MERTTSVVRWLPWLLVAVMVCVPILAWIGGLNGRLSAVTWYSLFPLLGVWAWSIMWVHYVFGAIRLAYALPRNELFSRISGYMVLACVLLHPGILSLLQANADQGLPPSSVYGYVGAAGRAAVTLGVVAFLAFISYEVLTHFREQRWVQQMWPLVSLSQMIAMTFIFVHGLRLGQHLHSGWFQLYWVLLGALLIPAFTLIGRADWVQAD